MSMTDFRGLPVVPSAFVERGSAIIAAGTWAVMHPLDIVGLEHPAPLDRLDAAMEYLRVRAVGRFDKAIAALDIRRCLHDSVSTEGEGDAVVQG